MSLPITFAPIKLASSNIPPVPQNGSSSISFFFIPEILTNAQANFGCREIGEK